MLYDHERKEIKSSISALASMIGFMLSEVVFDVKRGRWDRFNDAIVRRRDALMNNQKALQRIISRLEKQHKSPMDMIITKAPQSLQPWLQMLDDASDLLNMMLEIANSPPQLRDPEFSKATYNKMVEFYNKYKSMLG
jgi:2-methylisocitrate lyase-like PEP mutase family enzyme